MRSLTVVTVLASLLLMAAPAAVFAASEAETAAADEGPVVIDWVGLRLPLAIGAVAMLALLAWTSGRLPRLATAFEARG